MTELKEFLFDFDFDDIQLMKEIDHVENEKDISNDGDILDESDPEAASFSEEQLLAARQEGFEAGKEEGVQETLSGVENNMCQILDKIALGISGVVKDQNAFNDKATNDTLELTLSICRKLFPVLSEEGKLNEVSSMTEAVVSQILTQPKISVFVNSNIVASLKEKIDPFLAERGYEGIASISEDPSLPISGCRIQWKDGEALRNPESGLRDIEQIVSSSLNDQNLIANLSQGPDPVKALGVEPEASALSESDTEEHADIPPVSTTIDETAI
tara:strand:+ start:437 stop:1252 length:816 start_codon:yes stop_codon:yes gene_type:complete